MKRKYILIGFAALLSVAACEPSHLEDNLYDPSVYILNNGYQKRRHSMTCSLRSLLR